MRGSLVRTRWAAIGAAVAVSLGGGTLLVANAAPTGTQTAFKSVSPCRLLDTRLAAQTTPQVRPQGIWYGKLGNRDSLNRNDITVILDADARYVDGSDNFSYRWEVGQSPRAIMGDCNYNFSGESGINPDDVITSVVLNVTVVEISADSFVTVYPWTELTPGLESSDRPLVSNLNPLRNVGIVANQVTVDLEPLPGGFTPPGVKCSGGDFGNSPCADLQAFRVYNHLGTNHVIIDVMGYHYIE